MKNREILGLSSHINTIKLLLLKFKNYIRLLMIIVWLKSTSGGPVPR